MSMACASPPMSSHIFSHVLIVLEPGNPGMGAGRRVVTSPYLPIRGAGYILNLNNSLNVNLIHVQRRCWGQKVNLSAVIEMPRALR